jgi:hypothetical protein
MKWLRRFFDYFPHSPGLIRRGNWRVVYPDGKRSAGVTYDIAQSLQERFGGTIEWIDRKTAP